METIISQFRKLVGVLFVVSLLIVAIATIGMVTQIGFIQGMLFLVVGWATTVLIFGSAATLVGIYDRLQPTVVNVAE